jgi:hypothetical protein
VSFAAQYQSMAKDVFVHLVQDDLARGTPAEAQARRYSERGKPDFVLAYLLHSDLSDDEKRELLAESYERRAALTRERAEEFSQKFHRDFPFLLTEASHDHQMAEQIRAGKNTT